MGRVGMNPAQLLIFYEACSGSRYTDPLDLRGATLGNMNLKTEFQRFAAASWPPDRPVLFFHDDLHLVCQSENMNQLQYLFSS